MDMESTRDARRRKILARGSDRLAFITGQAQFPPPSAVTTAPHHPPKRETEGEEEAVPVAVGLPSDNVASNYELPKDEPSGTTARDIMDTSFGAEPSISSEKINEAADITNHSSATIEPISVHGPYEQVVNSDARLPKEHADEMFTAKRVSSSISASENIRLLCATSIALLVVLSYHGYPLGGEAMGSIVSFRPIFLVLLTDVSLILGILFTTNWGERDAADAVRAGQDRNDWTDQMSKALELVLLLQKLASAAFLDCCLCAVVIICGTSFGKMY